MIRTTRAGVVPYTHRDASMSSRPAFGEGSGDANATVPRTVKRPGWLVPSQAALILAGVVQVVQVGHGALAPVI